MVAYLPLEYVLKQDGSATRREIRACSKERCIDEKRMLSPLLAERCEEVVWGVAPVSMES